jgi:hypothetical protein
MVVFSRNLLVSQRAAQVESSDCDRNHGSFALCRIKTASLRNCGIPNSRNTKADGTHTSFGGPDAAEFGE